MMRLKTRCTALAILLATASPAAAQETLQERVASALQAESPGTRFGLVVAADDGRELVAIRPEDRFIPASNTKMFTTAAAFANLQGLDGPDLAGGAAVRLDADGRAVPDAILEGRGDARLSSAADCVTDCLAVLADAVAAKVRAVNDVIGDDSLFPDERWSPGMSWNNIETRSGTGISALTIDDNELPLRVFPAKPGQKPRLEVLPYYKIDNQAITTTSGPTALQFSRMPGSDAVRLTGRIMAGAEPGLLRLAIDDPAHYAAWRFKTLLEARGVKVRGEVAARHRPLGAADDPKLRGGAPAMRPPRLEPLASLAPPPLIEDLKAINKVSQNVHAELLLRRVGRENGTGSIADGVVAVRSMLEQAGVPRAAYDFADGSGMSTYNRVAPRGMVTFLRWTAAQPWGAAWRDTLPVGGVDGTLSKRFKGTPLEGRLFAKTGTLNASNALSGYMTGRSGRILTFSAFANDVPQDAGATKAMDKALELIAEAN